MNKKFYITTAIPYVNAKPHIGHALEFVQADTVARYHREILGEEVILLSGGDENALKNVQAAEKAGKPVQEFIDENAKFFQDLAKKMSVRFDVFQKGSDRTKHFLSSQKLWTLCEKNGDIYKKSYTGLYCVGCEQFYTEDELDAHGECFEHPGKKLDTVSEENYFFRLSKYQKKLVELISDDTLRIVPEFRKNEVMSFLNQPLFDISISRSNARAKNWGVPVPGDDKQKIYVWFDALNIYQSGVGFGWDEKKYRKWWPADVHVIGKGIIRFHAVYWPAFLLSAGLEVPKSLFVHGYFTINGQKMSKTLGNIIDPFELIEKYGADALRYYFLREIPSYNDGDFSEKRFRELYNADLANNLGNLVSRVEKLALNNNLKLPEATGQKSDRLIKEIIPLLDKFQFEQVLSLIWTKVTLLNRFIDEEKPWSKNEQDANKILTQIISGSEGLVSIPEIADALKPFMPATAEEILSRFSQITVKPGKPLFPRII